MKIVLTTHQFLPYSSAGTEVLTLETAKELKRRGHDVEVWTGHPADADTAQSKPIDHYEYDGLKVHRYNQNYKVFSPNRDMMEFEYNSLAFRGYFTEYVKKEKPDIVHFFHLLRLSASAVEVCLDNNIPCVFTPTDFWMICQTCQLRLPDNSLCLGPDPEGINCCRHLASQFSGGRGRYASRLPHSVFKFFIRAAGFRWWPERNYSRILRATSFRKDFIMERINRVDRVLAPTRFMEKTLIQNGVDPGIIDFMPYGLNMKAFEKKAPKKPSERLRVGFIGTLSEHKGAHLLIEAVKLLPQEMPVEVKIYGDLSLFPDYTEKIKRMAEGDSRIEFPGQFPNEKIGEVFAGIDVLVVPSIWYENTPLVIYSAFAASTPVIATNLGGMSEVVSHGVNGLLFEKGDARGLSALLKRCVEESGLLEKLSGNVLPPKSMPRYADELEEVYGDVLKKRRKI
ncbi:MAG: glycosyltransferase family 4 protein [Deltaproteobacteria bacterium]|nr:glycosyltransferase family 4 protein [Deltaproteobacteria bacterium]